MFKSSSVGGRADEEFDELVEFIGGMENVVGKVFVIGLFGKDRRSVDFSDSKCHEVVPVFRNWHFSIPCEINPLDFEAGRYFVSSYGVPWPGVVSVTKDQIKRNIESWAGTNLDAF